jgi:hypothetical protein
MSYGGARTFRVRYKDDDGETHYHSIGRWSPDKFNVEAARAKKFDPQKGPKPKLRAEEGDQGGGARSNVRSSRGAIHLRSGLIIAHAERDRAQASGPVLELVIAKSHPRCRRRDTHYLIRATRARRREHPRARCLHSLQACCHFECRYRSQRHSCLPRVQ